MVNHFSNISSKCEILLGEVILHMNFQCVIFQLVRKRKNLLPYIFPRITYIWFHEVWSQDMTHFDESDGV